MKFICDRGAALNAVNIVQKAVAVHSTVAILEGVNDNYLSSIWKDVIELISNRINSNVSNNKTKVLRKGSDNNETINGQTISKN